MRQLMLSTMTVLALGAGLAGSAQAYRWYPVPAPRAEVVPPARAGYVWRPGYWNYGGGRYAWVGGAYVTPRPGYSRWAPGYWGAGRRWYGGRWVR